MVQLPHPYMTAGKTIALTRWTFVGKVMSLLFNTLPRLDSFSSKKQESFSFVTAVTICSDFQVQENKICHSFHFFPIYLPWSDGTRLYWTCYNIVSFYLMFWVLGHKACEVLAPQPAPLARDYQGSPWNTLFFNCNWAWSYLINSCLSSMSLIIVFLPSFI